MVRTVNRQPFTTKQLDYDDIKYKFFNHTNWKGVCDDKNYLGIDQETFADSKNVYVDSEGILKSRPSIKLMTIDGLTDIVNVWTFGPWQVYQTGFANDYKLRFRRNDELTQEAFSVGNDFRVVLADQKIFVFEPNKLSYFDLVTNTWYENAIDKIYIPVTELVEGNVTTEQESKNELTTSYITRYLYQKGEQILDLKGKTVTVTIDDNKYTLTFGDYTAATFVKKLRVLTDKNYKDDLPLVFINNDTGVVMLCEYDTSTKYTVYYSIDGIIYYILPYLSGQTDAMPAISQGGAHVFAVLYRIDGPYAYSVAGEALDDGSTYKFSSWTNLYKYKNPASTKNITYTGSFESNYAHGYYIDDTLMTFYAPFAASDVHLLAYSGNNTMDITDSTDTPIGTGKLLCNSDIVANLDSYFQFTYAYRIRDGKQLSNIFVAESDKSGEDIIVYWGQSKYVDTLSLTRSLQISYILPVYETGHSGEVINSNAKLVVQTLSYSETDMSTDSFVDYKDRCSRTVITLPESYTVPVNYVSSTLLKLEGIKYVTKCYGSKSLISTSLIVGNTFTPLLFEGIPVDATSDNIYLVSNDALYGSNISTLLPIDYVNEGQLNIELFDHEAELSQYFISKGKKLYITATGAHQDVDDFKWYFPVINTQEFDYEITNLHPISTTEMAVFLQDSIYYIKPVTLTINNIETTGYTYYKSRIPLGCEEGSDVITSYDNKYTMFVTKRGFVAMSYQDFISSEEQALTFLSDTIYDVFSKWNDGAIKLFQYNFWIILYKLNTAEAFVFDMRGNSWWPVAYNTNVKKLIEINRTPLILKGQYLYQFDKSNDNYFDGNSIETGRIDWHITSQKLHLSAINYYKHIVNLTFFGYNYDDKQAEMRFNIRIINYRKQTDTNEQKSFEEVEYKIQLTRTYVKRINYYKVNQVQYVLESPREIDEEDKTPIPLSLTCISLKYLITGQVR